VEAFETALNAGDLGAAERESEAACWQKDCKSLAEQATQKFKVRRSGSPQVRGLHAAVWLDVLCDGTRLCDRVLLLMAKECGGAGAWRVAQVTERKKLEGEWLESALADCPKF
jgi:hypothetical protein